MPERRVVIDHISVGVTDLSRSREFYRRALEPLGMRELGPWSDDAKEVAFGHEGFDDFAISTEYPVGAPVHVAFAAESEDEVRAFHAAALEAGGRDNGRRAPASSTARATSAPSCSTPTGQGGFAPLRPAWGPDTPQLRPCTTPTSRTGRC